MKISWNYLTRILLVAALAIPIITVGSCAKRAPGTTDYSDTNSLAALLLQGSGNNNSSSGSCNNCCCTTCNNNDTETCSPLIRVVDEDKNGIEGANVTVSGGIYLNKTSVTNGLVEMPTLKSDSYSAKAIKSGYKTKTVNFTVTKNYCPTVTIMMLRLTPAFLACKTSFTFKDAVTNQIINNTSFTLNGTTYSSTTLPAIANGSISIALTNGTYSYSAAAYGYNTTTGTHIEADNDPCSANIILLTKPAATCNATFTIQPSDKLVSVALTDSASKTVTKTTTSGSIIFPGLVNGIYSYSASCNGYDVLNSAYTVSGNTCPEAIVLLKKTPLPTYTITYVGNGNTGGSAPTDSYNPYVKDTTVTVLGANTLTKEEHTFAGWKNASGTNYAAGSTFVMPASNIVLSAQWTLIPTCSTSFTFIDNVTLLPVNNVSFTLTDSTPPPYMTAVDSTVTVDKMLDDFYSYSASAVNYQPVTGEFAILGNNCEPRKIFLTPTTCDSTFTFIDELTNLTINEVSFTFILGTTPLSVTTGSITLPDLVKGTNYSYSAAATGYKAKEDSYNVPDSGVCGKTIALAPAICSTPAVFTFKNELGQLVTNVSFIFDGVTYTSTTSPAIVNASISFTGLADKQYPYTASATGYATVSSTYTVSNNVCDTKTITLTHIPCIKDYWSTTGSEPGCSPCISGSTSSTDNKSCICTGTRTWDQVNNTCNCPDGTIWDEQSQSCNTPTPATLSFYTNIPFTLPWGIALSTNKNIYVAYGADTTDSGVYEWDNNGTPIKSIGVGGTGNGQFNDPRGIAIDGNNNIYVSDTNNNRIQKFSIHSDGSITFVKTWGLQTNPYPNVSSTNTGIAVDSQNNVYVKVNGIQKFSSDGVPLAAFGAWDGGAGCNTCGMSMYYGRGHIVQGMGVAIDASGRVNVLEDWWSRIQLFSSSSANPPLTYISQTPDNSMGTWAEGIAINKQTGDIYTAVCMDSAVRKMNSSYTLQKTVGIGGMNGSSEAGSVMSPFGIAVDEVTGYVYVADTGNGRINVYDANLNFIRTFRTAGIRTLEFTNTQGITHDSSGNIYIVDYNDNRVHKFDSVGNFITDFGWVPGGGNGSFSNPTDIAVDSAGNNYVADTGNKRIQKSSPDGYYMTKWGTSTVFKTPTGIAIHNENNVDYVYVTDSGNNNVKEFDTAGTLIATWSGVIGTETIKNPTRILVSSESGVTYLYINNTVDKTIQKFRVNADKTLTFILKIAGFNNPAGMAVDAQNNLYVANYDASNTSNNKIMRFTAATGVSNGTYSFNSATQPNYITIFGEYIYITGSNKSTAIKINGAFLTQ